MRRPPSTGQPATSCDNLDSYTWSNVGDYKGWIGLSALVAYPSTMERDNAFIYISIPKHHAFIYRNYPNPLGP
jgi:hypothetical protein